MAVAAMLASASASAAKGALCNAVSADCCGCVREIAESAADLGAEMFRSPPRSGQTFSPVPGGKWRSRRRTGRVLFGNVQLFGLTLGLCAAMGWLSPGMLMDSPLRFLLQSPGAVAQAELQAPMNQTPISATCVALNDLCYLFVLVLLLTLRTLLCVLSDTSEQRAVCAALPGS